MKTRFLTKDRDGTGSVTGWVVWGFNYLNQRRQFACDGVRTFYQPDTRSPFIEVTSRELPANARQALLGEMKKTEEEWEAHMEEVERSQRDGNIAGLLGSED